jgi:hypothetical protein
MPEPNEAPPQTDEVWVFVGGRLFRRSEAEPR